MVNHVDIRENFFKRLRTYSTQAIFKSGTLLVTGELEEFSRNVPVESIDAPSIHKFLIVTVTFELEM